MNFPITKLTSIHNCVVPIIGPDEGRQQTGWRLDGVWDTYKNIGGKKKKGKTLNGVLVVVSATVPVVEPR